MMYRRFLLLSMVALSAFLTPVWTALAQDNLLISEFMASNSGSRTNSIRDEDGDSSDWIEIFNPGTNAVSLLGWFLTDTETNLTEWEFPDVTLLPNSYLVVFASQKNRTVVTGKLHTNFQLSKGGEYLALVDPATNVVSDFAPTYPAQTTDVSYGRDRADPTAVGFFTVPTPGAPNLSGGAGFAPDVKVSESSGTFTNSFLVQLSVDPPNPNVEIRYTLNGQLPILSYLFSTNDFTDLPAFVNKLKQATDPVSSYLTNLFSGTTATNLAKFSGSGAVSTTLRSGLISDLNKILAGPSVYQAQRFAGISLRPETQQLLAQNPLGDALVRLNRLLIEDAYALEISRIHGSFLYTSPILVTNSMQIIARAFQTGLFSGAIHSETYLKLSSKAVDAGSDLPIVVLHQFANGFPDANASGVLAFMEIFEPKRGRSSMTNAPDLAVRTSIHNHGSSTAGQPKHNIAMEVQDEAGDSRNVSILGMPAESDWILYAPNNFELNKPRDAEMTRKLVRGGRVVAFSGPTISVLTGRARN